jgi:hypothetical protein
MHVKKAEVLDEDSEHGDPPKHVVLLPTVRTLSMRGSLQSGGGSNALSLY